MTTLRTCLLSSLLTTATWLTDTASAQRWDAEQPVTRTTSKKRRAIPQAETSVIPVLRHTLPATALTTGLAVLDSSLIQRMSGIINTNYDLYRSIDSGPVTIDYQEDIVTSKHHYQAYLTIGSHGTSIEVTDTDRPVNHTAIIFQTDEMDRSRISDITIINRQQLNDSTTVRTRSDYALRDTLGYRLKAKEIEVSGRHDTKATARRSYDEQGHQMYEIAFGDTMLSYEQHNGAGTTLPLDTQLCERFGQNIQTVLGPQAVAVLQPFYDVHAVK